MKDRNVSGTRPALNLSEKFRLFVILVSIHSGWIHLSTLSEFAGPLQVDFDPRVRLEFRGTQLSSDGGLLVMRELDDALGLSNLASVALCDFTSLRNLCREFKTVD